MNFTKETHRRVALLCFGLLKGVVYTLIYWSWTKNPHTNAMLIAPVIFTGVSMTVLTLSWNRSKDLRLYPIAFITGAVFALLCLLAASYIPEARDTYRGDWLRIISLCISTVMAVYILFPYIQTYNESRRFKFPYEELFKHSWNNLFILETATLFTLIFYGFITLWWNLFKIIGIDLFKDIFHTAEFNYLVLPVAFGLGAAIAREREKIILTLRTIMFSLAKILLPMLTLIALLFIVTLPFTGLDPLWSTKKTSPIILILLSVIIIYINAVFQMGTKTPPYSKWLRRPIEVMVLTMPIYTAIALYSTSIRIGEYGLTPMRVYAVLIELIAMLYAVGYSVAVIRRGDIWLDGIKKINVWVSLVIVGVIVLVHTPVLDPFRLSANSQYDRIISGEVTAEDFDFAALKFKLGKHGYDKLLLLKDIEGHPEAAEIKQGVEKTLEATNYYQARNKQQTPELTAKNITVLTPSGELPEGMLKALNTGIPDYRIRSCAEKSDAVVFALNIDDDPEDEHLFVSSGECFDIYVYDNGVCCKKQYTYKRHHTPKDKWLTREEFISAIENSNIEVVDPEYQDLIIDGNKFRIY